MPGSPYAVRDELIFLASGHETNAEATRVLAAAYGRKAIAPVRRTIESIRAKKVLQTPMTKSDRYGARLSLSITWLEVTLAALEALPGEGSRNATSTSLKELRGLLTEAYGHIRKLTAEPPPARWDVEEARTFLRKEKNDAR